MGKASDYLPATEAIAIQYGYEKRQLMHECCPTICAWEQQEWNETEDASKEEWKLKKMGKTKD